MQRKTLPNSSACCRPDEVNSPPHLQISSNEASFFSSADSSELESKINFILVSFKSRENESGKQKNN